ncbi:MAG TPA: tripartite tricarboxylate transporter substrate binding protein [Burkholderiales bacterium]|nr:tripartite tricarboxylate transporter substrate binding protein [Burkholderiales bacterium]
MVNRIRLLLITCPLLLASVADAQTYPTKPIRILVGTPPGGGADFLARGLAPKLTESLGQPIVVENRPGANGAVASEVLARSVPDGYLLKVNVFGDAVNPLLIKVNFDFIKDFSYIALAGESQNILASHPSLPVTGIKGLVALSKAKPGGVTYGSQGIGASGHLSGELFQYMTGVKWVHVPYKGGAPALIDLLAGNITISFANIPTAIAHVRSNRLRALAVTGGKRTAAAPDIPTVGESGVPGYQVSNWFGLSAPAKTAPEVITRLNTEIVRAINSPDLSAALRKGGTEPSTMSPAQYTAFVQGEYAKWAQVIKAAGIKGE